MNPISIVYAIVVSAHVGVVAIGREDGPTKRSSIPRSSLQQQGRARRASSRNLPSAPSRPSHLPDIDYGDRHPFDYHRHSYDDAYNRRNRDVADIYGNVDGNVDGRGEDGSRALQSNDDEWNTTTIDPDSDSQYRPLRLKFDVSDLLIELDNAITASDTVSATKLYLLIYEILPMTSRSWGDMLRVIPVNGGIYPLAARGGTEDDKLIPTDGGGGDGGGDGGGGGGGGCYDIRRSGTFDVLS
jgi:hypothetical protein